eukprot:7015007-Lingulodinium_polyedra.AAC.1
MRKECALGCAATGEVLRHVKNLEARLNEALVEAAAGLGQRRTAGYAQHLERLGPELEQGCLQA